MFYPRRILLLFLLMFHIGDNSYYWNQIDEISSKPLPQSITRLDGSFWPEIRRHYSSIMVQLNDKASQDIEPCTIWREIGYIATKYKFSTNCVSLARYNWEAIDSVNAKIVSNLESSEIEGLSLYLMTNSFQLMNRADMCSIKIEELYFFYESNNCLAIPSEDS